MKRKSKKQSHSEVHETLLVEKAFTSENGFEKVSKLVRNEVNNFVISVPEILFEPFQSF